MLTLFTRKLGTLLKLVREGRFQVLKQILSKRLYSRSIAWGLYRQLDTPCAAPSAAIPISVRPYRDGDWDSLSMNGELYSTDPETADGQAALLKAAGGVCYVAVDDQDRALFMQPVFGPGGERGMEVHLNDAFPVLDEGVALLEGAYTRPDHRGLGIMPAAVAMIANRLREGNVTRLITFVAAGNLASLKALHKAGFSIYSRRRCRWLLFRRETIFEAPGAFEHRNDYGFPIAG